MEPIKIRHPRLDAWYNSSVMNIASIGAVSYTHLRAHETGT